MDGAQEEPRLSGGENSLRSRRGDAGQEKCGASSSHVVGARGITSQVQGLPTDNRDRDLDKSDCNHPDEVPQNSKGSFSITTYSAKDTDADDGAEASNYAPPSLVLMPQRSGVSLRSGWPVLLWALGAAGSWTGVAYGLSLSWKETSEAHVHLQHALWLSQIGLLCLSLAFDCCRKLFVMGTMFVLLPATGLHFRGLDFEPTISLMHIISSIHYHYVQDMDNPRAVQQTHETLMVLDYFWAHLDICSSFVYLSGIRLRLPRALIYMAFVYGLVALLTSKDRKSCQRQLSCLVLGGGASLIVGRVVLTGEAPSIRWSGLPISFILFGYAAHNFFVLQEKYPSMYWLHHGLWHITGNATLLSLVLLKYHNE